MRKLKEEEMKQQTPQELFNVWFAKQPTIVKELLQMFARQEQREEGIVLFGVVPTLENLSAKCEAVLELQPNNTVVQKLKEFCDQFVTGYQTLMTETSGGKENGNASVRDSDPATSTGGKEDDGGSVKNKGKRGARANRSNGRSS